MNIKQAEMQAEQLTRDHINKYDIDSNLLPYISGNDKVIELERQLAKCYAKNSECTKLENELKDYIESLIIGYLEDEIQA